MVAVGVLVSAGVFSTGRLVGVADGAVVGVCVSVAAGNIDGAGDTKVASWAVIRQLASINPMQTMI